MSTGGANEFTLAAWVYLDRTGHRHAMMTKQGNETRGVLWSVEADNRMNLQLFKNQARRHRHPSTSTLSANRWYHVAVTYRYVGDGSSRVRLYIDGAPAGGTDSAVGPPAPNAIDLNIGRYWWNSAYSTYFDGRIDEFMICDRELDPAEITQVHSGVAATAATPQISPAGGEFVTPVDVSITSPSAGAEIYYTLDGSEPTVASTRFTAPFSHRRYHHRPRARLRSWHDPERLRQRHLHQDRHLGRLVEHRAANSAAWSPSLPAASRARTCTAP